MFPVEVLEKLSQLIPGSSLVEYETQGHYSLPINFAGELLRKMTVHDKSLI